MFGVIISQGIICGLKCNSRRFKHSHRMPSVATRTSCHSQIYDFSNIHLKIENIPLADAPSSRTE